MFVCLLYFVLLCFGLLYLFCFVLSFVCLLNGFFWPEAICNIALGGCCWDVGMALETATICWNSTNQQKTAFLNRGKDDTLNKRQETSTREQQKTPPTKAKQPFYPPSVVGGIFTNSHLKGSLFYHPYKGHNVVSAAFNQRSQVLKLPKRRTFWTFL